MAKEDGSFEPAGSAGGVGRPARAFAHVDAGPHSGRAARQPCRTPADHHQLLLVLDLEFATGAAQRVQARRCGTCAHSVFPRNRATQASQPRKEIAMPTSAIIISSADTAAKNVAPARSQANW